MLGSNYKEQLEHLMREVAWEIQLPPTMERFFQEAGPANGIKDDERVAARLRVRTKCLLMPEAPLPAFPRRSEPVGIYMADISRYGLGFLAPEPLLPEEEVRLFLPTFWLRASIARSRRLGSKCYEVGARLTSRHDPSNDAFKMENELVSI